MIREKIDQAIGILREKEIDMWITFVRESSITGDPMLSYICDIGVTWQSAFILTAKGERIAIVGQYDVASLRESGHYQEILGYVESAREHLRSVVLSRDPRKIALNYNTSIPTSDGLTTGMYMNLQSFLKDTPYPERFISAEPVISSLRGRKTPEEIRRIREACRRTLNLFDQAGTFMAPGRSEAEVAAHVLSLVEANGYSLSWDRDHCPAVYSGPGTAGAHASPTARHIQPGHLINMDFGVRCEGYCADLQRTWYVLRPGENEAPEAVRRAFRVLRESVELARKAMRPGVTGVAVDRAARHHLVENGYAEFPHGLGHQVGRETHDGGALLGPAWEKYGSSVHLPLEAGQVFTIEPRITLEDYGIVTLEEEVVLGESGCDYLNPPQEELLYIRG